MLIYTQNRGSILGMNKVDNFRVKYSGKDNYKILCMYQDQNINPIYIGKYISQHRAEQIVDQIWKAYETKVGVFCMPEY